MSERWLPVVGYEGAYEVSDLGRVRSLDRWVTCCGSIKGTYVKRSPSKLLKPQRHSGDYVQFSIGQKTRLGHEIVMTTFVGPCPPGLEVCHGDGDKKHNALSNLRYGTHIENCVDRRAHGFNVEGVLNPSVKLTPEQVLEIRRLARSNRQSDVAEMFGISQGQVNRIFHKQQWRHV